MVSLFLFSNQGLAAPLFVSRSLNLSADHVLCSSDQTGQYSTQIFSLAVLLSSLFLYNQMGGIDEAALDRLSLVTEMSKHIAIKVPSTPPPP